MWITHWPHGPSMENVLPSQLRHRTIILSSRHAIWFGRPELDRLYLCDKRSCNTRSYCEGLMHPLPLCGNENHEPCKTHQRRYAPWLRMAKMKTLSRTMAFGVNWCINTSHRCNTFAIILYMGSKSPILKKLVSTTTLSFLGFGVVSSLGRCTFTLLLKEPSLLIDCKSFSFKVDRPISI